MNASIPMGGRSYPADAAGTQLANGLVLSGDWHTAQARWLRLDDRRRAQRAQRVRWERRGYAPEFFEVRAVDRHGRGLGSERHAQAFPVPYRSLRLL